MFLFNLTRKIPNPVLQLILNASVIQWATSAAYCWALLTLHRKGVCPALEPGWFSIRRWSWPTHSQVACAQVKLTVAVQSKGQQQPNHAHNFSLALSVNLSSHLAPTAMKTMIRGLNHRCLTAVLSPPLKCNYQAGLIYIKKKSIFACQHTLCLGDVNNFSQVHDLKIMGHSMQRLKGKSVLPNADKK